MSYGTRRPTNPMESQQQTQQQNPFGSGSFNTQSDLQASLKSTPETIILECNRLTSRQDDNTAQAHKTNHRWITEFASGIELKNGDEIRINSAFISSIGVGDLIAWDIAEGSSTQDNKSNWITSYYVANDNLNDKRAGYNMDATNGGGRGKFPYDCDNSAMPLYRVVPLIENGAGRTDIVASGTQSVSYSEDKFLPCRFFGETFDIFNPVIDNHLQFILTPKKSGSVGGVAYNKGTTLHVESVEIGGGTLDINSKFIFGLGQTIYFEPQDEPRNTPPSLNNHSNCRWIFTIADFIADDDGVLYIEVDQVGDYIQTISPQTEPITLSAKVKVSQLPFNTSINEGNVPIATTILPNDGSNCEIGKTLISYVETGLKFDNRNFVSRDINALNDDQTGNENTTAKVVLTPKGKNDTHIPINVDALKGSQPNIMESFQDITFNFEDKTLQTTIKTITDLITLLGTNIMIFDLYDNSSSLRETCNAFIIDPALNNGVGNVSFTIDNKINILGVKRALQRPQASVKNQGIFTNNIEPNNAENNYIVKADKFFGDMRATYSHEDVKQFIGISPRYSDFITTAQDKVGYYGWIQQDDDSLDYSTLTNTNNLTDSVFTFTNLSIGGTKINRNFMYQGYEDTSNIGKREVKHYSQFKLEIDENYSSPSDIATSLTNQTHKITDIRDRLGNIIPNTSRSALAQNDLFFPVWTTSNTGNVELDFKVLQGEKDVGSFFCKYTMHNSSENICELIKVPSVKNVYSDDGDYEVYFKTQYTTINKPTPSTFNDGGTTRKTYTTDFNQSDGQVPKLNFGSTTGSVVGGQTIASQIQYAVTFNQSGQSTADIIGFPIAYAVNPDNGEACLVSQYAGSNNIEFSWDDTNSRFKIDFLHQPSMSKFEATPDGVVQTGDEISNTIYFPSPVGKNGYLYKLPRTRCGGVNIENWTSNFFTKGMTPEAVRIASNLSDDVDLSSEWFINDKTLSETPQNNKNYNVVGNRFWTKLGYNNSQLYSTNVGTDIDTTTKRYNVLGTTDNLVDIADALITTKEPPENTPFYTTIEDFEGKVDSKSDPLKTQAQYQFSSIGSMQFNNHLTGYGLPNTAGLPLEFRPNFPPDATSPDDFSEYQSTYNPDRQRNNGYVYTTEGDALVAKGLPIKTEFPYFLVMSDLVQTDFNVSANYGSKLNCVGIISKLNAEQDFYFQYQAPQSFYCKKDMTISSITTEIRTPSLSIPPALSPYSSVIYQIVRYAPMPTTLTPPIWFQQQQYFSHMTQLLQNIADQTTPPKQNDKQRLQEIMTELASSVERPDPNNQSSITQRIITNYDKLNLARFNGNQQAIKQFLTTNPDAEPLLQDLNAFRNIPSSLQLPSDAESTNPNTLLNSLLQAQPYQPKPADQETLDEGGGVIQESPPQPPSQTPDSSEDLYNYVLSQMGTRMAIGNRTEPLNQRDINDMGINGFTPQALQQVNSIISSNIPAPVIQLGSLTNNPSLDARGNPISPDSIRNRITGIVGGSYGSDIGSITSNPETRLEELEDEELQRARDVKRQMGDSSSKASSVAPSYKTKPTAPPSYKSAEPNPKDEDEK